MSQTGAGQAPLTARSRIGYIKKYAFPKGLAIRNIFSSPSSILSPGLSSQSHSQQSQLQPLSPQSHIIAAPRFEVTEYHHPSTQAFNDTRRRRSVFSSNKSNSPPTPASVPQVPAVVEPVASHFVASTHKPQRCPLATQHDYPTESKITYVYQPSVLSDDYARSDTASSVDSPVPSRPPALGGEPHNTPPRVVPTPENVEAILETVPPARRRRTEQESIRDRYFGQESPPSQAIPAIVRVSHEREPTMERTSSADWEGANWRSSITAAYAPSPKPQGWEDEHDENMHVSAPRRLERRQSDRSERRHSRAVETHHPQVYHRRSMAVIPREDPRTRATPFPRGRSYVDSDRMVQFPAMQAAPERPKRPRLTSMSTNSTGKSVRWNTELVCPSPVLPINRRKGWYNRRGDQLWTNDGAFRPASPSEAYPHDLDGYPEAGWMNEEGVQIDVGHHLVPKSLPKRSALKQLQNYAV